MAANAPSFKDQFGIGKKKFKDKFGKGVFQTVQQGGVEPLAPGQAITDQNIQPFLGGGGKVAFDPATGAPIPKGQRVRPGRFQQQELVGGPAVTQAQDFEFTGLPASPTAPGGAIPQLQGAAQNLLGGGGQQIVGGGQAVGTAVGNLLGTQAAATQAGAASALERQAALQELQNLQQQALSPGLTPDQRALFQQRADERLAEVRAIQSDVIDEAQRARAGDIAQLAARGVLDSTTGANVLAERERRLAQDVNRLSREAGEISRQELLGERGRIGQTATSFGGLQGQQAGQAGSLLSGLLGTQADIGGRIGQLGLGQQGIGADLAQLGVSGLGTAGQLGIAGRGQEADLQQAALSTRLLGSQLELANRQALANTLRNRRIQQEQLELQRQLANEALGGGGLFGSIGNLLGF